MVMSLVLARESSHTKVLRIQNNLGVRYLTARLNIKNLKPLLVMKNYQMITQRISGR